MSSGLESMPFVFYILCYRIHRHVTKVLPEITDALIVVYDGESVRVGNEMGLEDQPVDMLPVSARKTAAKISRDSDRKLVLYCDKA